MLMKIDEGLILRLEHLARLQLSATERQTVQQDLNRILEMVAKLDELSTEGIEPLTYINEEPGALREDAVAGQADRAAALRLSPDEDGAHFRVPKVIDL